MIKDWSSPPCITFTSLTPCSLILHSNPKSTQFSIHQIICSPLNKSSSPSLLSQTFPTGFHKGEHSVFLVQDAVLSLLYKVTSSQWCKENIFLLMKFSGERVLKKKIGLFRLHFQGVFVVPGRAICTWLAEPVRDWHPAQRTQAILHLLYPRRQKQTQQFVSREAIITERKDGICRRNFTAVFLLYLKTWAVQVHLKTCCKTCVVKLQKCLDWSQTSVKVFWFQVETYKQGNGLLATANHCTHFCLQSTFLVNVVEIVLGHWAAYTPLAWMSLHSSNLCRSEVRLSHLLSECPHRAPST